MNRGLNDISVGPFRVCDLSYEELVDQIADWTSSAQVHVAMALHVGGLNLHTNLDFLDALGSADLLYADGAAVVMLAKANGAHFIERSPTTDLGHSVIDAMTLKLGRPVRVALIGGTRGLAATAAATLQTRHEIWVVATHHGFQNDWIDVCNDVRKSEPDLVFVGLGMPFEAKWLAENAANLGPVVAMSCGGWFGFLAGAERRAPLLLQRLNLEWLARSLQQPRLIPRYVRGIFTTLLFLLKS